MNQYNLPSPDRAVRALWKRVPDYIRWSFFAALITGFLTHMFVITNKLVNHDDTMHLFSATYGTPSGRWFLPTVLQWDGNFSIPWLIGVLSLLFLAVTVCVTVCLLRVRKPVSCVVVAALMTAFPTIASTFSYMFTSDAYFFGTMLAALGAYTAVRFPRAGIVAGAAFITLSMGIYQSYFPVAAALMVGAMLFETLDGQKTFRQLVFRGIQLVATLGLAMAAYIVLVKITTRDVGLVDYMGISTMGQLSLSDIPVLILQCYREHIDFFLSNSQLFHLRYVRWLFLLAGFAATVLLVWLLRKAKLGGLRTALAVVLVALYPLACNLIYIMTSGGKVHTLMIYGTVLLPVAAVALGDYAGTVLERHNAPSRNLRCLLSWVIVASMAAASYSYAIVDNKAYLKLHVTYEQGMAYSTRLLSAIERCDGYTTGMPVVLINSNAYTGDLYPVNNLNEVSMTGVIGLADLRTSYNYNYFLRYYLGYTGAVYLTGSERAAELEDHPAVREMPVYPSDGGVRIIDGTVVVKLGPTE